MGDTPVDPEEWSNTKGSDRQEVNDDSKVKCEDGWSSNLWYGPIAYIERPGWLRAKAIASDEISSP